MPRRHLLLLLLLLVVVHVLVVGWFAATRPIDGDEGYYGLAARLVAEGQAPYADFFYPQAPLLPYLYAPGALAIGAQQLPGLRTVSVIFSGLTLLLAACWLWRTHGQRAGVAVTALLILALCPELIQWNATVKTFAWTNLMTLTALVALSSGLVSEQRRMLWLVASGLALGLATSARLLFAPAALVPAVWLALRSGDRRWPNASAWLSGLALGLVPVWIAVLRDPAVFWFNNVGYHQLRFSELENASVGAKALAALQTMVTTLATNPGLLLMVLLAVFGAVTWRRAASEDRHDLEPVALFTAGALLLTNLVPDPVYAQYFTGTLPVLLLPAVVGGLTRLPIRRPYLLHYSVALVGTVACLVSLLALRHDIDPAPEWRLDHYRAINRKLVAMIEPDDVLFSFWSGYVAGSGAQPFPGMENHFAVSVSERLNARDRNRFHIAGRHEMARAFRREEPDAAVVGTWMNDVNTALDDQQMIDLLTEFTSHYVLVKELDGVKLCRRARDVDPGRQP